ncbi:hypothetical protein [Agromyces binzhouensis]|uniref:hypothetical protein n=1 Tax=Agromyces binzhouensis TaxID=1817495 RepID=UPI0036332139
MTPANDGATPVDVVIRSPYGTVGGGQLASGATKSYDLDTGVPRLPAFTLAVVATAPDRTERTHEVLYPGSVHPGGGVGAGGAL